MKKLAIITSHPIQYNAPMFRLLAQRGRIHVRVFYTWGQTKEGEVYDPDFQKAFRWDIPLLDGYEHEFIHNLSENPGAGHFRGIINRDLIPRIDAFQPDALLVFGWSFHSHLKAIRHYSGHLPILFRGDSNLLDEQPGFTLRKGLRRIFLRWLYRHVDTALYTGAANRAYYKKAGMADKQLVFAPHAVDNTRFTDPDGQLQQQADAWRSELGIPPGALVFLFAGKLEPKKDPLLLLDAFLGLTDSKAWLVIAGNGVLEEQLKAKAAGHPRILFTGFRNQREMPVLYRVADVFVLPSRGPGETWGLSVNEAMASGRAVIVSDRCGCAADLVHKNGFIISAGNKSELFMALNYFFQNPQAAREMGVQGLQVVASCDIPVVASVVETVVCN
ncbi:MAG TPA: glycosyltransferase family 4 protein [Lacibacter sp.]|nr:glycosyltransferase family 4 protein [Lacibacter sp.]HMO88672.1 glycosyltransferase family 4 protein [Lacibacter sp.]